MPKQSRAPRSKTVLIRIKRFGDQFATCGIGIRPPEHLVGDARMKRLCPKLVPGQVVELPADHPLATKRGKNVEIVHELEDDEILRPWVFKTAEDAVMANPSKSRLSAEQITSGLAMASGAIENAPKHRKKAQKEREKQQRVEDDDDDFYDRDDDLRYQEPDDEPDDELDDEPEDLEDEEQVSRRASNRQPRSIKEAAKPVEDDEPDDEPEAPSRTPRRRPSPSGRTAARVPRKTGGK